jgi:multicomponent Na+:H+ antiporter subunit F
MMALAILLAVLRLIRGPSLPDRVVALDLISILVAGATAIYAIATGLAVLLEVATVIALIAFLGTVAFAHYIERQVSQ